MTAPRPGPAPLDGPAAAASGGAPSATAPPPPRIALYGRAYWDVTVAVEPDELAAGKGKLDRAVDVTAGGFAANAARALGADAPAGAIHLVTVASRLDVPRLRAALPAAVALEAIDPGDDAWLPITVVLNPARDCRILRDRRDRTDACWRLDRVGATAGAAALHVVGRLPADFVAALIDAAHARGARVAWCGGADLPEPVERACDLVCVNAREAVALLGGAARDTRACAAALAARADGDDVARIVTGAGAAPTAVAWRCGGELHTTTAAPTPIAPDRIATLLGVGDVFAARFVEVACFDADGRRRTALAVPAALAAALAAAAGFLTGGSHRDG